MSAVATSAPPARVITPPATARPAPRLFDAGEVSLEDAILGAWEDLAASGAAGCPVCGGRLRAARTGVMGGDGCRDCGSRLE